MLAVEELVKTLMPCSFRISTSMWVVDDFPALPLMITKPKGSDLIVSAKKLGAILETRSPGNADPPPRLTMRSKNRTVFPTATARE
jgi:hypothetical protein